MVNRPSILLTLRRLWAHLSARRHTQFGLLLLLIILASLMEVFSIGAVLPFLGVMTAPEYIFNHPRAQWFIHFFHIGDARDLLLPITLGFVALILMSALTRLLLVWATARLTFAAGADLSMAIYRRTLYQPYTIHISRNSSEVITGITAKSYRLIHNALFPATIILSSTVMIVIVLSILIAFKPIISLATFGGFAAIYLGVILCVKHRMYLDSELVARESVQIVKALQEGLGGIRDVLIDGAQEQYCKIYQDADLPLRRAQGNNAFIALSPRLLVEAIGMVLVTGIAYVLSQQPGGLAIAIPILGALAIGAQRLLPVLQQAYGAWASLQGEMVSVNDAINLLDQPLPRWSTLPKPLSISFKNKIELQNIFFRYNDSEPWTLRDITLAIPKGSRIGFMGSTGSGKSTLLDLIMGLLHPTRGELLVDNQSITVSNMRAWQAGIAHVPQAIFLADCSVEENIAFGVPKDQINKERVRSAALMAQVADVIEALPHGYETLVGERGARLSGGQRQRIGIARALYKEASVIIFDEATSALDSDTESAVISSIDQFGADVTVLMIAHRLTTLSSCDHIIELANGAILRQGSYKNMVEEI